MRDLNARTGNEDGLHKKLGKQPNHLLPDIEANYFGNWHQVVL